MGLSNSQYSAILREYERLQAEERRELSARRAEVFRQVPELYDLERRTGLSAMESFRAALKTGNAALRDFSEENRAIEERKAQLLRKAGFPPDELEPRYVCEKCRDTGFVAGKKCSCFSQKAIRLLYAQSGLERVLAKENFDYFSLDWYDAERMIPGINLTERSYMETVLGMAKEFVREFDTKHGNILFQGNTGTGKTFLSNCIARAMMDTGHSVISLTAGELFDCLASVRIDKTEDLARQELFEYIFSCDLLIVDDLGTETVNTFTVSQFFYLVSRRLKEERSTVISTNLSTRMLRDTYTERVTSRILSGYDVIMLYGEDIRRKKRLAELQ